MTGDSEKRRMERTPRKCFICGPEDKLVAKYPKPPRENEKWRNQVHFNYKRVIMHATTTKNNSDQNIYACLERIYANDECTSGHFGDSLQLTNWVLDS